MFNRSMKVAESDLESKEEIKKETPSENFDSKKQETEINEESNYNSKRSNKENLRKIGELRNLEQVVLKKENPKLKETSDNRNFEEFDTIDFIKPEKERRRRNRALRYKGKNAKTRGLSKKDE